MGIFVGITGFGNGKHSTTRESTMALSYGECLALGKEDLVVCSTGPHGAFNRELEKAIKDALLKSLIQHEYLPIWVTKPHQDTSQPVLLNINVSSIESVAHMLRIHGVCSHYKHDCLCSVVFHLNRHDLTLKEQFVIDKFFPNS